MVVVVGYVLDGVVVAVETDGRDPGLPLEFAGNVQVGVAAREDVPAVIGDCFGCVGKVERVVDFDAAAPERFRAHGDVVSAQKKFGQHNRTRATHEKVWFERRIGIVLRRLVHSALGLVVQANRLGS